MHRAPFLSLFLSVNVSPAFAIFDILVWSGFLPSHFIFVA